MVLCSGSWPGGKTEDRKGEETGSLVKVLIPSLKYFTMSAFYIITLLSSSIWVLTGTDVFKLCADRHVLYTYMCVTQTHTYNMHVTQGRQEYCFVYLYLIT